MRNVMTKKELASQLAQVLTRRYGKLVTRKKATDIVEDICDLLLCHFQNGGSRVDLRGFGAFKRKRRKAFEGTDPRNGRAISIKAKTSITFKPGADAIRRIN